MYSEFFLPCFLQMLALTRKRVSILLPALPRKIALVCTYHFRLVESCLGGTARTPVSTPIEVKLVAID